jgi:hypothetical protein
MPGRLTAVIPSQAAARMRRIVPEMVLAALIMGHSALAIRAPFWFLQIMDNSGFMIDRYPFAVDLDLAFLDHNPGTPNKPVDPHSGIET